MRKPAKPQTPTYRSWHMMLQRCGNPNNHAYARYAGRGIKVCERWKKFSSFLEDMGERPAGTTLDRINNDGNYEPGNCRWATPLEQAFNSSRIRRVEFNGKSGSVSYWSRITGIHVQTLVSRFQKGWTAAEALTTPPGEKRRAA